MVGSSQGRTQIDNWERGQLFIYWCSADYFLLKSTAFKVYKHEYMNNPSPNYRFAYGSACNLFVTEEKRYNGHVGR